MSIYIISADNGNIIKKLITGDRNTEYEELHILKPGISWSPNGEKITFSAKSGKSDALFVVDIDTEKVTKFRFKMEGIFRASWSPIGNEIAFIGKVITDPLITLLVATIEIILISFDSPTINSSTYICCCNISM